MPPQPDAGAFSVYDDYKDFVLTSPSSTSTSSPSTDSAAAFGIQLDQWMPRVIRNDFAARATRFAGKEA